MLFLNKMLTREACVERYGPIDLASLHWPDADKWIKMFEVPKGAFPNWKVLNSNIPVTHIACNTDIHKPLNDALTNLINRGLQDQLKTFDGCFNIRLVREGKELSVHSWGLAIDINAATNKLGWHGDLSPQLVSAFAESGWDWGGNFSRLDPMHLSFCYEGKK